MKIIVVVSQSGGSFEQRDFEESLIANLLMETEGIEVTVVPDIGDLDTDTTGLLCLEGIKGDMIFASWHEPQTAFRGLAEKGIYGRFGKTAQKVEAPVLPQSDPLRQESLPPGVYDAMKRRIYCLDLNGFPAVAELRTEVERIANENSVKTVQVFELGIAGTDAAQQPAATVSQPASNESENTRPDANSPDANSPDLAEGQLADSGAKPASTKIPGRIPHARDALMEDIEWDESDDEVDRLVDQFDDLDI